MSRGQGGEQGVITSILGDDNCSDNVTDSEDERADLFPVDPDQLRCEPTLPVPPHPSSLTGR